MPAQSNAAAQLVIYGLFAGVLLLKPTVPSARAADNELTPDEQAAGWKLLFNGKDHAGWSCNTGKPIATPVEDGCLLPHKSGGYIIAHEQEFKDFTLRCDVKLSEPNCNSGIFFRVGNLKNPVYTGFEVAIDTAQGTGYHDFGAVYDLARPSKGNRKGPDQWDTIELTCQGPLITVKVNGEEVTRMNCDEFDKRGKRPDGTGHKFGAAIKDLPREGYLGFQDHGAKVWFKNVKILTH